MPVNQGVHVYENATAINTPVTADVGIAYAVGTAPIHTLGGTARTMTPVLATSADEAEELLGYSKDWKSYSLCEVQYTLLTLYNIQPVIFCVVPFDTKSYSETATVEEHRATLPFEVVNDKTLVISASVTSTDDEGTEETSTVTLVKDTDYTVLYDDGQCIIELLPDSAAYDVTELSVSGKVIDPDSVTEDDIAEGISQIDACMSVVGKIPDLILAPGWSDHSVIAALMATKADGNITGLFRGKALIDVDCSDEGVTRYTDLIGWKNQNNMVDENQILCWPMVTLGDYKFHMSVQLAGLLASIDADNASVPYESPMNKNFKMDGMCLADGTEIQLTFDQANIIGVSYGIITALNFMNSGWVCWNNWTACYPSNTDVKDYFICVSRMFDYIANSLILTYWSKLGKPMTPRYAYSILDSCNIWLNGLVSAGYLLGARAEMPTDLNPVTDLMQGIIKFHVYITPPSPMVEIDFYLEYDADYVTAAFGG